MYKDINVEILANPFWSWIITAKTFLNRMKNKSQTHIGMFYDNVQT